MKSFALHFSDHFGKVCAISLGKAKEEWKELRKRGLEARQKPLKLKDMAGSLPEAVAKQDKYLTRATELLEIDDSGTVEGYTKCLTQAAEEIVGRGSTRISQPDLRGQEKEVAEW